MFRMFRLDVSLARARVSKQGHITDLPKYKLLHDPGGKLKYENILKTLLPDS